MKIILLQLPLQGHDFFFSNENIPLAAASLKAIAAAQGIDVELLPRHLMSYGSDQAILSFLMDAQPDLLGMSCYQWNIERSLFLSRRLKEKLPHCSIVLGGPEISADNHFLLNHQEFDIGVVGEGEPVWKELLRSRSHLSSIPGLLLKDAKRKWFFTGAHPVRGSLKGLPSPYLSGCLDQHLEKVLWLETVRGCPGRCAYCYYHKQSPRLRPLPQERVLSETRRAREQGIEEIVFLDPCFTGRPHLEALLDGLSAVNEDRRLGFHGEGNSEEIDRGLGRKLSAAGFTQMEIGLQSINRSTLKGIHRRFNPKRFLEGMRHLRDNEIKVMIDVISGLPGDTVDDVRRSLDWVLESEADDFLMLYPLSLLPATELRQRSSELGLTGLPYPPYLVTRSREMNAVEIRQTFRYYEERMEEDICPLEVAPSLDPAKTFLLPGGLTNVIRWQTPEEVRPLSEVWDRTAYALTIHFSAEVLKQPPLWYQVLKDYLENNPFTLITAEVSADSLPEDLKPLWELAQIHRHLIDRDFTVTHTPYRSFVIVSRAHSVLWKWPDPRESHPIELPDGQKIFYPPTCLVYAGGDTSLRWLADHLAKRYTPLPEIRIWEPPDDED